MALAVLVVAAVVDVVKAEVVRWDADTALNTVGVRSENGSVVAFWACSPLPPQEFLRSTFVLRASDWLSWVRPARL